MIFKEFSPAFKNVKIFHSSDIKITFSKYYFRNVKKKKVARYQVKTIRDYL